MKTLKHFSLLLVALAATLFALVGCGGGSSATGSAGSNGIFTFVTDDLSKGYDHVWVTFYSIDLAKSDGTSVNVYTNATGQQIDLNALHDSSNNPLYLLLGQSNIPAGSYKGFSMTVGQTVTLFATGATTSTSATFPTTYNSGGIAITTTGSQSVISKTFPTARTFVSGDKFEIDCVLKNWTVNGSNQIVPDVQQGNGAGDNNSGSHVPFAWPGVVSAIAGSAPTQTFTLTAPGDDKRTLSIVTSAATVVVNSDSSPNPILANGQIIEVRGQFDPSTKTVTANNITIRVGGSAPTGEAEGTASTPNSTNLTFNLAVVEAHGFTPASTPIVVGTTASTKFFGDGGATLTADQFYSDLSTITNPKVEAEGNYIAGSNTLTANACHLHSANSGGGGGGGQARLEGTVTADTATSSLTVTLSDWEGFQGQNGASEAINTTANTTYQNANGQSMTADQFFALVAIGNSIHVEGSVASVGVFTATSIRIRGDGGGGDGAEIFGIPTNLTPTSLDVTVIDFSGFAGHPADVDHIAFTATTTYADKNGNVVSQAQFLTNVNNDPKRSVTAEGTFSAGTLTAKRIRQNK